MDTADVRPTGPKVYELMGGGPYDGATIRFTIETIGEEPPDSITFELTGLSARGNVDALSATYRLTDGGPAGANYSFDELVCEEIG